MKSKKKIVLINPFLVRLRRNLRAILKEAYFVEINHLRALNQLYIDKITPDYKLSSSQRKRRRYISRKENELMASYHRSILVCVFGPLCVTTEGTSDLLDMDKVWFPFFDGWMCLPCYEHIIKRKQMHVTQEDLEPSFHITRLLRKEFEDNNF